VFPNRTVVCVQNLHKVDLLFGRVVSRASPVNFSCLTKDNWITVPCSAAQISNTGVHVLSEISNPMRSQAFIKRLFLPVLFSKSALKTARTI